jgi:hypothetical protein
LPLKIGRPVVSKTPLFDAPGVLAPELLATNAAPERSKASNDLERGPAFEHLACADLIMLDAAHFS